MSPMVVNILREWRLACPKTALDLVFPSENGVIHSITNIHKTCWGPLQRKLGMTKVIKHNTGDATAVRPRYNFHSLRHAAASLFIDQGWPPKKVQAIMGHSSIQVTFDTYGHLWKSPEDDAQAMALLEARLLAN